MATAKVGDRIRIKGCIPSMFFSDGDFALIEEVNENFVMALFDQPENKRVHGAGLWAVDHKWYELISGDEYRIASLERRLAAAISLIETIVEHEIKILENGGMKVIAEQVRERVALMKE